MPKHTYVDINDKHVMSTKHTHLIQVPTTQQYPINTLPWYTLNKIFKIGIESLWDSISHNLSIWSFSPFYLNGPRILILIYCLFLDHTFLFIILFRFIIGL